MKLRARVRGKPGAATTGCSRCASQSSRKWRYSHAAGETSPVRANSCTAAATFSANHANRCCMVESLVL